MSIFGSLFGRAIRESPLRYQQKNVPCRNRGRRQAVVPPQFKGRPAGGPFSLDAVSGAPVCPYIRVSHGTGKPVPYMRVLHGIQSSGSGMYFVKRCCRPSTARALSCQRVAPYSFLHSLCVIGTIIPAVFYFASYFFANLSPFPE